MCNLLAGAELDVRGEGAGQSLVAVRLWTRAHTTSPRTWRSQLTYSRVGPSDQRSQCPLTFYLSPAGLPHDPPPPLPLRWPPRAHHEDGQTVHWRDEDRQEGEHRQDTEITDCHVCHVSGCVLTPLSVHGMMEDLPGQEGMEVLQPPVDMFPHRGASDRCNLGSKSYCPGEVLFKWVKSLLYKLRLERL